MMIIERYAGTGLSLDLIWGWKLWGAGSGDGGRLEKLWGILHQLGVGREYWWRRDGITKFHS
jgi:hypothetical protein